MRVRKGAVYVYRPVLIDQTDARTSLKEGDRVRVCRPMGCPPPNTMGHAHVETLEGAFVGLVHVNSLHKE